MSNDITVNQIIKKEVTVLLYSHCRQEKAPLFPCHKYGIASFSHSFTSV